MSIKKTSLESPTWLKYFIIASLLLHAALMWALLIVGENGGWLVSRKAPVKKPVYVQVVELPPDYKVEQSSKRPPKKPVRYADKTSVVDVENIPGSKAAIITPLGRSQARKRAGSKKTTKASKAVKAVKAQKKRVGAAKPRRIFKTKNTHRRKRTPKKQIRVLRRKNSQRRQDLRNKP